MSLTHCIFISPSSHLSLTAISPFVLSPCSVQFDTETGKVVQLLQVETLLKSFHKAVLWVQPKTHSPQNLCVFLAQMVKSVHQLI